MPQPSLARSSGNQNWLCFLGGSGGIQSLVCELRYAEEGNETWEKVLGKWCNQLACGTCIAVWVKQCLVVSLSLTWSMVFKSSLHPYSCQRTTFIVVGVVVEDCMLNWELVEVEIYVSCSG